MNTGTVSEPYGSIYSKGELFKFLIIVSSAVWHDAAGTIPMRDTVASSSSDNNDIPVLFNLVRSERAVWPFNEYADSNSLPSFRKGTVNHCKKVEDPIPS